MTIECAGVLDDQKRVRNIEQGRLDPLRDAHQPGDVLRIVISDEFEGEHSAAFKMFHVMRDQYAVAKGLDKEYAKALLKYRHGITIPYRPDFKPPVGQRGAFLEVEEAGEMRIFWMKSTIVYTTEELTILILGTEKDIAEIPE